jgi:hypothetical protein
MKLVKKEALSQARTGTKKKVKVEERKQLNVSVPLSYYKILKKRAVDKESSPSIEVTNALTVYLKKKNLASIDEEIEGILVKNVSILVRKVLLASLPNLIIATPIDNLTMVEAHVIRPTLKLLKECFNHVSLSDSDKIDGLLLSGDGVEGFREIPNMIEDDGDEDEEDEEDEDYGEDDGMED